MQCPAGTYNAKSSANTTMSCLPCIVGKYSETPGANSSSYCAWCPVGTYNEKTGSNSSLACLHCPNHTSSPEGSALLAHCICNLGYSQGSTGQECSACIAGTYKPVNGSALCSLCVQGKFSSVTGAISETTCDDCPLNTFSSDGSGQLTNCTCILGHTGDDGTICNGCIAGTWKSVNGSASCSLCTPGKYSSVTASISEATCEECPAHTYSGDGSGLLINCTCNFGYSSSDGDGIECSECIVGTWKDVNGSSSCILCASGKWSNETGEISESTCTDCPAHTYSGDGSGLLINCTCNFGYSSPDGDGIECSACVSGTYKDVNGSSVCLLCARGSYSNKEAEISKSACIVCPSHSYTPHEGSASLANCSCDPGFTGPDGAPDECSACIPGTFKDLNGTANCTKCEPGKYSEEWGDISNITNASQVINDFQTSAHAHCLRRNLLEGPVEDCDMLLLPVLGCSSCPYSTFSLEGSGNRTMCICNEGYTAPDGNPCAACVSGKYKPVNGSAVCSLCQRGTYSTGIAMRSNDKCLDCPHDSFSVLGSSNITRCLCNAGYHGHDGGPCAACEPGTFKAINGTQECTSKCVISTVCPANVTWMLAISAFAHRFLDQIVFIKDGATPEFVDVNGVVRLGCTLKVNVPTDWRSSGNFSCMDYGISGFCKDGGYGTNWHPSFGFFADYADTVGVDAGQACCECGGGVLNLPSPYLLLDHLIFDQGATTPRIKEGLGHVSIIGVSEGCTHKVDMPTDWRSSGNFNCMDYYVTGFCQNGTYGADWQPSFGTFADYANADGVDAGQACCECGGGVIKLPSSYSIEITAPEYITAVTFKSMSNSSSTTPAFSSSGKGAGDDRGSGNGSTSHSYMGCGISICTNLNRIFAFEGSQYSNSSLCGAEVSWAASTGNMITSITYNAIARSVSGVVQAPLPVQVCAQEETCTETCIAHTSCTECEAGKYADNNVSAATSCIGCPLNTFSLARSKNLSHCDCNQGYTGPDGTACVSCDFANTYKSTRGSMACSNCTKDECETGHFRPRCNLTSDTQWCQRCTNAPDFSLYTSPGAPYFQENCNWTCDSAGGYVPSAENGTFCSVRWSAARGHENVCFSHPSTCVKCDVNCSTGFFSQNCACQACSAGGESTWPPVNSEYSSLWHVEGMPKCGWQCKSGLSSTQCSESGNGLCRLPCPVGTFGDANAIEGCQACPAGTSSFPYDIVSDFVNSSNATHISDCVQCSAGKYKPALGTLGCEIRESASLEQCVLSGTCGLGKCPSACVKLDQDRSVCCRAFADIADTRCQELVCVFCPKGSFSDVAGAASCQSCPTDSVSTPGSTIDTACKCAPGFDGLDGGSCSICAAGKYKSLAGTGGGGCAVCEAGKFSPDDGATICQLCSSSSDSVAGSLVCTAERVNVEVSVSIAMNASYFAEVQDQYVASIADLAGVSTSSVFCTAILNDSSAASSRRRLLATSRITIVWVIRTPRFHVAALKASIATAFVLRLSEIGPLPTLNALTEDCGSGREPDGRACAPCAEGLYKNLPDNSSCVVCGNGTTTEFRASIFEVDCTCTAGYFFDAADSIPSVGSCAPCPAGTFKPFGPGVCMRCADGTYSPGTSKGKPSASCIFCPVDRVRSPPESDSKEDCCGDGCKCDAGYNELDGNFECVSCKTGYYKSVQSTGACLLCGIGSFTNTSTAATSCTSCPHGSYNDVSGATVCKTCPPFTLTVDVGTQRMTDCKCTFSTTSACQSCHAGEYGLGPAERNVSTVGGPGASSFKPSDIDLSYPLAGNIALLANHANGSIMYVNISSGERTEVTWGGVGYMDGSADVAQFTHPNGVAASPDASVVLVAGNDDHTVRKIDWASRTVSTFAGKSQVSGSTDGNITSARFTYPRDLIFHPAGNRVYVAESGDRIRLIDIAAGAVSTVYTGSVSRLTIAKDGSRLLFTSGNQIKTLDLTTHAVRDVAGQAAAGYEDATGTAAKFNGPQGITLDFDARTAFIADQGNFRIRTVDIVTGEVATAMGSSSDYQDGPITNAKIKSCQALDMTPDGLLLLFADEGANRCELVLLRVCLMVHNDFVEGVPTPPYSYVISIHDKNKNWCEFVVLFVILIVQSVTGRGLEICLVDFMFE